MNVTLLSNTYRVRRLTHLDVEAVFSLCRKNLIFYQYHPPFVTKESILEDMSALPPKKGYEDKFYIGFFLEDTMIAVMDLILDYPREQVAFIGFFMMNMGYQGKGVGTGIIQECAAALAGLGYHTIQLGIDKGNPQSEAFWSKCGFHKTGREVPNDFSSYVYMEYAL